MFKEQINTSKSFVSTSETETQCSSKEQYHAPQINVHGKLERLTLQDTSNPTGLPPGGGDGGGL